LLKHVDALSIGTFPLIWSIYNPKCALSEALGIRASVVMASSNTALANASLIFW